MPSARTRRRYPTPVLYSFCPFTRLRSAFTFISFRRDKSAMQARHSQSLAVLVGTERRSSNGSVRGILQEVLTAPPAASTSIRVMLS